MIRVGQLKLPLQHTETELKQKAAKALKVSMSQIKELKIAKRSIDARKKTQVCYVYTVDVSVENEQKLLKKVNSNNIMLTKRDVYHFPTSGAVQLKHPPVIVGSGPGGLFCAYALAEMGYCPIVIERGKDVDARQKDVELFWRDNILDTHSNVQFGEGGAGTFSDGKLNTLVKDVNGRNRKVLDTFIQFGAPAKIGYDNKPHIGTDILIDVIKNMRKHILDLGGKFLFETCLTGFEWENDQISGVVCTTKNADNMENTNSAENIIRIETDTLVLAIGHSARDTFALLKEQGFHMEAKSFAVGFRVEHPQQLISENQYGAEAMKLLPAASYKVTANLPNKRGVYSFCMCPGGYVVNASSEEGRLAVNGMSYSGRNGQNANSAIIVSVTPDDFEYDGPLAGVEFQRRLEEKAFQLGNGLIPQQLFGDFEHKKVSAEYGAYTSSTKGKTTFAPLHELFPKEITDSFTEGMHQFGKYIKDFDRYDCILSGIESRTSSPVRISRNEEFESNKKGVYPCGEGAGYAGGIMSAAMDGLKIAEAIIRKYKFQ